MFLNFRGDWRLCFEFIWKKIESPKRYTFINISCENVNFFLYFCGLDISIYFIAWNNSIIIKSLDSQEIK